MVLSDIEKKERRRLSNIKYGNSEKGKEKRQNAYKKYILSDKGSKILKESQKKYLQTESGKKKTIKASWKQQGLYMKNFEEIYKRYTDAIFCDICECVLEGNGNNRKCMDHDHDNGEFRNVVCSYCNFKVCK